LQQTKTDSPVLIVGAGPSGLMMACQLAIRNIPFRIIDKNEHPSTNSGALIVHARSLEIFNQIACPTLGGSIADKAIAEGIVANKINIVFNGKKPISLDLHGLGKGITRYPYLLMHEQSKTEQLLIDVINAYGFQVERKTTLLRFCPDMDYVTVILQLPNGNEEIIKTPYLIAADGGQSLVRTQLDIPFPGKTNNITLFLFDGKADVNLAPDEICFSFADNVSSGIFPLTSGRWRIDGTILKDVEANNTVTFHDIAETFAMRTRMNIKLYEPQWFSVFHSHQRYAGLLQKGRCFLLGDAAHVLSPVGAQGMNTGLQDAYNLAWKLSLVIRGKAKVSLLNTYHNERQPIARKLVRYTAKAFYLAASENFFAKKFRLQIAPFLLKSLFPMIQKQRWTGQFIFHAIAETGIHYRKSSLSKEASVGIFPKEAPKPGDRLPFIQFEINGVTANIHDGIKGTGFHLLMFINQQANLEIERMNEKYNDILFIEVIPLNSGAASLYKKLGIKKNGFYLIRPDMHIACRSNLPGIEHYEKLIDRYFSRFIQIRNKLT
jgi:2-polyprenyl-6-methoxyphenol hydroxylase-like FAD-dependent oxidoreductase